MHTDGVTEVSQTVEQHWLESLHMLPDERQVAACADVGAMMVVTSGTITVAAIPNFRIKARREMRAASGGRFSRPCSRLNFPN